jgi:23S rRNA (adenine2030-N6)-methyltransferase
VNYRHVYHAGNFADVLKHVVLSLVIEHLKQKPAPFRVIDTHAGVGLYDLSGLEAGKTGEWRDGIGRLVAAEPLLAVADLLRPYLGVVAELNAEAQAGTSGILTQYPGSPMLARRLLRAGDALVANELHPEDAASLKALFARDSQVKVLSLDGWQALRATLPPKERRGVVLIDPPFEEAGELDRLVRGVSDAVARFATGTLLLWYPIKDPRPIAAFHRAVAGLGLPKLSLVELMLRAAADADRLNGTGLVMLNAPFKLQAQLAVLMPFLTGVLRQGAGASWRFETLTA